MPASSTSKKVHIQRFEREPVLGFVNPATFLGASGIEVLTLSGNVTEVRYAELKTVYFVREFESEDPARARRSFLSRPKLDGIWVKFAFRDGDMLEGVMPNNLLQVDALGVHAIPPHGAQRVFVPRAALIGVQVLGVVGSPLRAKKKPASEGQIGLFEESA